MAERRRKLAKRPSESAAASQFMSSVTDDLLVEILIRLPDYRNVIHCGLVCKRWCSLIFRPENYFGHSFNHHHLRKRDDHDSLPYTVLFRGQCFPCTLERPPPSYDLFCEKSLALHGNRQLSPWSSPSSTSNYLDFLGLSCSSPSSNFISISNYLDVLSRWPNPIIISSFQDLLFIRISSTQFWICNPLTKQVVELPEAPPQYRGVWHGFACKPNNNNNSWCHQSSYCNCSIQYKVVLLTQDKEEEGYYRMAILSSETGEWKESRIWFPLLWEYGGVNANAACSNGILYWQIMSKSNSKLRILAFDPFKETEVGRERFRLISVPEGFSQRNGFGVVKGRLRLSQYSYQGDILYYLTAWELNEEDAWIVVHDVAVKMKASVLMSLIGLHPDDGDVFFFTDYAIYCEETLTFKKQARVFKYHIGKDIFEIVGDTMDRTQWRNYTIEVFPLVHSWLPTKIPELPCTCI